MSRERRRVARLELDVLLRFLRCDNVLVVERIAHRAVPFSVRMMTMFLLSAYSFRPPAIAISWSTVVGRHERVRPRLLDLAGDEHLAAVDLLDDDGDVRVLDEPLALLRSRRSRSCVGVRARGLDVVEQRQRNLPVRPDRHLGRHVLVAPEHDRQHVVGADDVVGRRTTAAAASAVDRAGRRSGAAAGACPAGASDRGVATTTPITGRRLVTRVADTRLLPEFLERSWQSCLRRKFRNRL